MPSQSRRSQNLCLARAVEASGVLAERITEFEQRRKEGRHDEL